MDFPVWENPTVTETSRSCYKKIAHHVNIVESVGQTVVQQTVLQYEHKHCDRPNNITATLQLMTHDFT